MGATIRLFARLEDALTLDIIRTGTKPVVTVREPDGVIVTVPDASVDWVVAANATAFKLWSATAVWTPSKVGQHRAIFNVSAPYSAKADQVFWIEAGP